MKKNLKMYLLIGKVILSYLFVGVHMAYSDITITPNLIKTLSFTPSSKFIVGIGSFSPKIAKSDESKSIRVWSVENGSLIKSIPLEPTDSIFHNYPMSVSHNGNLIVVSFYSKKIGCYSLEDNKWLWMVEWIKQERKSPREIIFTLDDQKVIAVGEKHTVIYDAKSGNIQGIQEEPLSDYVLFFAMSTGATISPSGRYLAAWQREPTAHGDILKKLFMNKEITIWDVMNNQFVASWRKPKKNFCHAVFTPDEKSILFSSLDGYISEWSISDKRMVKEWKHSNEYFIISPDGRYIAILGKSVQAWDSVQVRDYVTSTLLLDFGDVWGGVAAPYGVCEATYAMAFSPDSKYFALEKNGQLCLYETETWREKWCIPSYTDDKQASKAD